MFEKTELDYLTREQRRLLLELMGQVEQTRYRNRLSSNQTIMIRLPRLREYTWVPAIAARMAFFRFVEFEFVVTDINHLEDE